MELDAKVPHNKKRNVGLVYNFLIQNIATATVRENKSEIDITKQIIKNHFQKESELLKELKIFKKIVSSNFKSTEIALKFLNEIKTEVKKINCSKLETEKTILIHEINKNLNKDGKFYNQFIKEYKLYATIQVLLSNWASQSLLESKLSNINFLSLEDSLLIYLTETKANPEQPVLLSKDSYKIEDKLVSKIMHEKFEQKYSSCLNQRQKRILSNYISENKVELKETLEEAKNFIISEISGKKNFKALLEEIQHLSVSPTDDQCTFFIGVLDILRANNGEVIK